MSKGEEMAFVEWLDLRPALVRAAEVGAGHVPGAVSGSFLRRLKSEVQAGPRRKFRETFGQVRQQIEGYDVDEPFDGYPAIAELCEELRALVRSQGAGIRGLATWVPNEAGVAIYRPGSIGITPHLDGKRYRRLVAVLTVWGSARFTVCRTRAGEVVAAWNAGPGSLTLMRAPGLAGRRDGRPFHMVSGPRGSERCSLGIRMSVPQPS